MNQFVIERSCREQIKKASKGSGLWKQVDRIHPAIPIGVSLTGMGALAYRAKKNPDQHWFWGTKKSSGSDGAS